MKIIELLNAVKLMINNEEADLLKKFDHSDTILKSKLDEREKLIATRLVEKNVLRRKKNATGKIEYTKKFQ